MTHGIFLIHSHDQLVKMREQPYNSEDLLQRLLARYSNLLADNQIDRETPRRWLLVPREAAVPDRIGGKHFIRKLSLKVTSRLSRLICRHHMSPRTHAR